MAHGKDSQARGVISAFLVGGLLGAMAGLLFAPQRGKKLRADISEKATNLIEDGEMAVRSAKSTVSSAAKEVERKAGAILSHTG